MNESGKIVVPAKYGFAYPFGRNGLAIIQNGDKVCAIDNTGKEVVPFGAYDNMGRGFKNGNNIAHIGKTAYLINKEGSIIKTLVNSNEDVWCGNYYFGDYLVIGEGTDMKYIFDCNGNIFGKVMQTLIPSMQKKELSLWEKIMVTRQKQSQKQKCHITGNKTSTI